MSDETILDEASAVERLNPERTTWYLRIRFQFLLVVLFAIVSPLVFRFQLDWITNLLVPPILLSSIAALAATLVTIFSIRRLRQIPGSMTIGYVITTIALIYGLFALLFFLLRLDYSRYLFVSSASISTIIFVILHIVEKRNLRPHFALVPGGLVKALPMIEGIDCHFLRTPKDFESNMGAVVADLRHNHTENWDRFITEAAINGIPVYHFKQIKEAMTGKVEIDHLSENNFGSIIPDHLYLRVKQIIDFIVALLVAPAIGFLVIVLALLIRKDTGGSAIYAQQRVGYRGEHFTCYKLRTMRAGAQELEGENGHGLMPKDLARTKDQDHRITKLGALLRKYRIDELPQVINILKGEMSWIGPRPEAVPLSLEYQNDLSFYRYRHIVRPGISGWAQVNQGHVTETDQVLEKLHYDFFYIKNLSLALDLMIVIRTIATIIRGWGAR